MKTYQVIMKNGLTTNIEADGYRKTDNAIEFIINGSGLVLLRAEMVARIDLCEDHIHHDGNLASW